MDMVGDGKDAQGDYRHRANQEIGEKRKRGFFQKQVEQATCQARRGIKVAGQHHRYRLAHDITDHSATNCGEDPAEELTYRSDAILGALGDADGSEDAKAERVAVDDDVPAVGNLRGAKEDDQAGQGADGDVGAIGKGGDRGTADQHVADHAASTTDRAGEDDDAKEIQLAPHPLHRTGDREDDGAEQIEQVNDVLSDIHTGNASRIKPLVQGRDSSYL